MQNISVRCCIAGGGPAGIMVGLLLARAGVDVVVLEKHADFFRDFRGDTIHPSTLELMHELGCLDELLKIPHQKARQVGFQFGNTSGIAADFSGIKLHAPYIAIMPQWDFLDFLARRSARYPTFSIKMRTEVTGIIEENARVIGVAATTPRGPLEVRADLIIAADGRHSLVREKAGLAVDDLGAPMDVLWLSIPRKPSDPEDTMGRFDAGRILVAINRGDYWQMGYVIPKGTLEDLRQHGLPEFRAAILRMAPYLADRGAGLDDWEKIKLLTIQVNRLRQWHRPGLLCIGDAAHAMSPVGGVGINLAVQDAVAASNILAGPLAVGAVSTGDLARIQRRREFPTRLTQRVQALIRKQVGGSLDDSSPRRLPWPLRLLERTTLPRRMRTRFIGVGIRPEHVKTPDVSNARSSL